MSCRRPKARSPNFSPAKAAATKSLPEAKFCAQCGESLQTAPEEEEAAAGFEPGKRIACSDGMCIGIIGPDGKCTECGKPHNPAAGE